MPSATEIEPYLTLSTPPPTIGDGSWKAMQKFAGTGPGQSLITMLDQILVSAANFLVLVAIARFTTTAQTGTFVLALRTVDFMTEIQNVFIWAPYTLFAPGFDASRRRVYAGSVMAHQAAAALVCLVLLGGFGLAALAFGWPDGAVIAFWSMPAACGIHLREFVRRISFANLQVVTTLLMDTATFLMQAVGIAALWFAKALSAPTALVVVGAASGLSAAVFLLWDRHRYAWSRAAALSDFKRNFSYGRWLLGSDLALLIGNQIYPWFLASFSGRAAVAVFAGSQALTNFARMFLIGAQNILLPGSARAAASGSVSDLRLLVRRGTLVLTAGAATFSLVILVASGRLLALVYGPNFAGNGHLMFVLSLSILAGALTLAPSFALAATGRADENLRINGVTLALHVTAGLFFVWMYGALGAAYGLAIGGFVAAILRWRTYARLMRVPVMAEMEQSS
jgi:O-antigen/teichoic acid export membrane protein